MIIAAFKPGYQTAAIIAGGAIVWSRSSTWHGQWEDYNQLVGRVFIARCGGT